MRLCEYFEKCGHEFDAIGKHDKANKKYYLAVKVALRPRFLTRNSFSENKGLLYHCNMAASFCYLGYYELAIEHCQIALSTDFLCDKIYAELGFMFLQMKKNRLAVEAFRKAQELNPEHHEHSF